MDEKTRILISLGAAVASNCAPCFDHFIGKTETAGVTSDEIREAVEIADQVRNGARITMMGAIRGMIGGKVSECSTESGKSCCG